MNISINFDPTTTPTLTFGSTDGFSLGTEPLVEAPATGTTPLVAQLSRVRGLDQDRTAPGSVRDATNEILFGGSPPEGFDPDAFSYDVVPRGQEPLGNRWGRVALDPTTGRLAAYVAPEDTIRQQLARGYADATHGMTPDQVVDGMIANEVAGKAATIAFPGMPAAQREILSEAASYAVAGDNWAFRHLIGIQGEHQDREAGLPPTNYELLLDVTYQSMGEAAAAAGVVENGDARAGAELTDRFFDFMAQPGVFQNYTSFPDAFRGFAQSELGLSPAEATAFATNFAGRMATNTRARADQLVDDATP